VETTTVGVGIAYEADMAWILARPVALRCC
jgi:hypothetical protein